MKNGITSLFFIALSFQLSAQEPRTKNLILITIDGLRWQEVFTGADSKLLFKEKFVRDKRIPEKFWDESVAARRTKLMPFLWSTVEQQGQLYGNRYLNNNFNCSNPYWFSYPGYSEMLVGFVDKRIRSNDSVDNPNTTVLDYIQAKPGFESKVAAFATWDVIGNIACQNDEDFEINVGSQHAVGAISESETLLNDLQELLPSPHGSRYDVFTFYYAFEYLKRSRPRVTFISLDETDAHGHVGRYDSYLDAAHKTDMMLSKLWSWLQSQPDYRDQTTVIITTDHGRGRGRAWKNHGRLAFGSGEIWLAVIGPDTPALGEITGREQYYQNQIASTAAALLGFDYVNSKPVGSVVKSILSASYQQFGKQVVYGK